VRLFNNGALPSSFTRLPAAPFLVPAIIEALSRCERYAELVEVVPGEADLYCADYLRTHEGVVFTGDSDLLIHELGDGAVCFFKDIDLSASGNKTSLTCIQYQVGAIAQRLGLARTHGLLALAFEMTMDAHASFREILQKAVRLKAVSLHGPMYQEFSNKYRALQSCAKLQETCSVVNFVQRYSLSCQLKMLDPRVSEYLLQFSEFAQAAQLPESIQSRSFVHQSHVDVFLPFLLDCPLRTSAWEMSTSVRQLAYGLVNLVLPKEESVLKITEYRRLQNGSRGKEWLVPAAKDLPKACADLHELFQNLHIGMSALPEQNVWRALAMYQDQELHLGTGKSELRSTVIKRSKGSKTFPFRLTWEGIHLSAQFQGSYYSFRILKQILSIVLLCDESKTLPLALHQLHTDLKSLPTLGELPPAVDIIRNIGKQDDQRMLEMVQGLLGIQLVDEMITVPKKRNKKKPKIGDAAEALKSEDKSKRLGDPKVQADSNGQEDIECRRMETNNIFELLSTD
jgi:XPG domain containing